MERGIAWLRPLGRGEDKCKITPGNLRTKACNFPHEEICERYVQPNSHPLTAWLLEEYAWKYYTKARDFPHEEMCTRYVQANSHPMTAWHLEEYAWKYYIKSCNFPHEEMCTTFNPLQSRNPWATHNSQMHFQGTPNVRHPAR